MGTPEKLYQYYQEKGILPTYAGFSSVQDLQRHKNRRARLFLDKLYLSPRMFQNSRLVEFGPDSGENSLVFASWGASVTLVEPNPNAWFHILNYFEKFGLSNKLSSLIKLDLEHFETTDKFHFIVAEGFIYTVRPESRWIQLFDNILEENGFLIISYMEIYGSLLELILKLIYTRAKDLLGQSSKDVSWTLFRAKWESIPHIRSFDSWVKDVLKNPFVRIKYFFDTSALCKQLSKAGFSLYSSWPSYIDCLNVYWHKKELTPERKLANNLKFIARSCLSFIFGKKLFLCSNSEESVKRVNEVLIKLLTSIDRLIDSFDVDVLKRCDDYLDEINDFLINEPILVDSSQEKLETFELLNSIRKIFNMLVTEDIDGLIALCNSDSVFINSWGQPCHFAVFARG